MIALLSGTLLSKSPTELLLDVNGVGYAVHIPVSTFEKVGDVQSSVTLHTYLHVREDALQLYGFATEDERNLFRMLISVSGIGPKMAQTILSGVAAHELRAIITGGNHFALTKIPGVGKKIAERLVVELRERIGKVEMTSSLPPSSSQAETSIRSEALLALTSLGFNRAAAEKAVREALLESPAGTHTLEGLIKEALKRATGK